MKRKHIRDSIKALVLLSFIIGNILNIQFGMADNGDFSRSMDWFSSGPMGSSVNWPTQEADWKNRFINYYLPYWKMDFPLNGHIFSSTILIWLPGIALNYFFYSSETIYLPVMTLFARLIVFYFLWLLLLWIDRRSRYPELHYIFIALPFSLMFAGTDISAMFNSFYLETGVIVYLLSLIIVIVSSRIFAKTTLYYSIYFIVIFLYTMTRSANFYIPFIVLPFVVSLHWIRSIPKVTIPVVLAILTLVPAFATLRLNYLPNSGPITAYNSLFQGVLQLSNNPKDCLEKLNMEEEIECMRWDSYTEKGNRCIAMLDGRLTYLATIKTIIYEPKIILRLLKLMSFKMQNTSIEHLGKRMINDNIHYRNQTLNIWSEIKKNYFPRGYWLIAIMPLFAAVLLVSLNREGIIGDLALIGTFSLFAMWIEMYVQILGDGLRDLDKHLLLANIYFDILLISVVGIGVTRIAQRLNKFGMNDNNPVITGDR